MKKLLILALLVPMVFLIGTGCNNKQQKITEEQHRQIKEFGQEVKILPKEIVSEEFYNIVLESNPIMFGPVMRFSVRLKNLNISPFITNIGTNKCTLIDNKGEKYKADLSENIQLEKAILPGEEISVVINGTLSINFIKEGEVICNNRKIANSFDDVVKCIYDNSGLCLCKDIGSLIVDTCDFSIRTDGKQAGDGWGEYPLTVKF